MSDFNKRWIHKIAAMGGRVTAAPTTPIQPAFAPPDPNAAHKVTGPMSMQSSPIVQAGADNGGVESVLQQQEIDGQLADQGKQIEDATNELSSAKAELDNERLTSQNAQQHAELEKAQLQSQMQISKDEAKLEKARAKAEIDLVNNQPVAVPPGLSPALIEQSSRANRAVAKLAFVVPRPVVPKDRAPSNAAAASATGRVQNNIGDTSPAAMTAGTAATTNYVSADSRQKSPTEALPAATTPVAAPTPAAPVESPHPLGDIFGTLPATPTGGVQNNIEAYLRQIQEVKAYSRQKSPTEALPYRSNNSVGDNYVGDTLPYSSDNSVGDTLFATPTPEETFLREHKTKFDPYSTMDRGKMEKQLQRDAAPAPNPTPAAPTPAAPVESPHPQGDIFGTLPATPTGGVQNNIEAYLRQIQEVKAYSRQKSPTEALPAAPTPVAAPTPASAAGGVQNIGDTSPAPADPGVGERVAPRLAAPPHVTPNPVPQPAVQPAAPPEVAAAPEAGTIAGSRELGPDEVNPVTGFRGGFSFPASTPEEVANSERLSPRGQQAAAQQAAEQQAAEQQAAAQQATAQQAAEYAASAPLPNLRSSDGSEPYSGNRYARDTPRFGSDAASQKFIRQIQNANKLGANIPAFAAVKEQYRRIRSKQRLAGYYSADALENAANVLVKHQRLTQMGVKLDPIPVEFDSAEHMKKVLINAQEQVDAFMSPDVPNVTPSVPAYTKSGRITTAAPTSTSGTLPTAAPTSTSSTLPTVAPTSTSSTLPPATVVPPRSVPRPAPGYKAPDEAADDKLRASYKPRPVPGYTSPDAEAYDKMRDSPVKPGAPGVPGATQVPESPKYRDGVPIFSEENWAVMPPWERNAELARASDDKSVRAKQYKIDLGKRELRKQIHALQAENFNSIAAITERARTNHDWLNEAEPNIGRRSSTLRWLGNGALRVVGFDKWMRNNMQLRDDRINQRHLAREAGIDSDEIYGNKFRRLGDWGSQQIDNLDGILADESQAAYRRRNYVYERKRKARSAYEAAAKAEGLDYSTSAAGLKSLGNALGFGVNAGTLIGPTGGAAAVRPVTRLFGATVPPATRLRSLGTGVGTGAIYGGGQLVQPDGIHNKSGSVAPSARPQALQTNGYFQSARIGSAANKSDQYGGPMQNFLFNVGLPTVDAGMRTLGMKGLMPQVTNMPTPYPGMTTGLNVAQALGAGLRLRTGDVNDIMTLAAQGISSGEPIV